MIQSREKNNSQKTRIKYEKDLLKCIQNNNRASSVKYFKGLNFDLNKIKKQNRKLKVYEFSLPSGETRTVLYESKEELKVIEKIKYIIQIMVRRLT